MRKFLLILHCTRELIWRKYHDEKHDKQFIFKARNFDAAEEITKQVCKNYRESGIEGWELFDISKMTKQPQRLSTDPFEMDSDLYRRSPIIIPREK